MDLFSRTLTIPIHYNTQNQVKSLSNDLKKLESQMNTISNKFKQIHHTINNNDISTQKLNSLATQYINILQQQRDDINKNILNKKRHPSITASSTAKKSFSHIESNELTYDTSTDASSMTINWNSIDRIADILKEFDTQSQNNNLDINNFDITTILNDYHYIVKFHHNHYEHIYQYISKKIKCNPLICPMNTNSDNNITNNNSVLVNILNYIHIYIFHSYDLGYRLNKSEMSKSIDISDISDNPDKSGSDNMDYRLYDRKFDRIIKTLKSKKNQLKIIRNDLDINENRFVSISSNITSDRKNYSFGHNYYYWKQYKFNDMFVNKKYTNLKSELLFNGLNKIQYNETEKLSQHLLKSNIARKIYVFVPKYGLKINNPLKLEYIISIFMYCRFDNLCDNFSKTFRRLHKAESITEMKLRNSKYFWMSRLLREIIDCYSNTMKESKTKIYYHGTSYLLFDLFVVKMKGPVSTSTDIAVAINFCNHSDNGLIVELNEYSPNLRYFNVSWISPYPGEQERLFFGNNGYLQINTIRLIKEKKNYYWFIKPIRYFQCLLRGTSIKNNDDNKNNDDDDDGQQLVLDELRNLSKLRSIGSDVSMNSNINNDFEYTYFEEVTQGDVKVMNALIDHYLGIKKNLFEGYINKIFKMFCKRRREIRINIVDLYNIYEPYSIILKTNDFDNLLKLDKLVQLFPNVETIIIDCWNNNHNDDDKYTSIDNDYISKLSDILKIINQIIILNKHSGSLKNININNVTFNYTSGSLVPLLSNDIQWEMNINQSKKNNNYYDINLLRIPNKILITPSGAQ